MSKLKATEKNLFKKINSYQIIKKSVEKVNSSPTAKYKRVPNDIENKTLNTRAERDSISQGY